jgi:hypothetical protein
VNARLSIEKQADPAKRSRALHEWAVLLGTLERLAELHREQADECQRKAGAFGRPPSMNTVLKGLKGLGLAKETASEQEAKKKPGRKPSVEIPTERLHSMVTLLQKHGYFKTTRAACAYVAERQLEQAGKLGPAGWRRESRVLEETVRLEQRLSKWRSRNARSPT